jgi:hypothetical protein
MCGRHWDGLNCKELLVQTQDYVCGEVSVVNVVCFAYLILIEAPFCGKKIGRYLQRWELDAAIDVLTMCSCHLSSTNPLLLEVARKRQLLQQYGRILQADNRFTHWQEVPLCT